MHRFFVLLFFALFLTGTMWAQTHVILVRHGETQWNKERRLQGHADNPLNAEGQRQAELFSEKVTQIYPDIQAIYSSDLDRAYHTASPLATKLNIPIQKRSNLREIDYGPFDGLSVNDPLIIQYRKQEEALARDCPDRHSRWEIPPADGIESNNQLMKRLKKELHQIAQDHPNQTVVVFSHGRAIRILLYDILDCEEPFPIGNCEAAHLSIDLEKNDPIIIFEKLEKFID